MQNEMQTMAGYEAPAAEVISFENDYVVAALGDSGMGYAARVGSGNNGGNNGSVEEYEQFQILGHNFTEECRTFPCTRFYQPCYELAKALGLAN